MEKDKYKGYKFKIVLQTSEEQPNEEQRAKPGNVDWFWPIVITVIIVIIIMANN